MSNDKCREIMDYEKFVSIVRDAADLGAKTICLSGGEPFLHNMITEMVEFVASLGLQTYIYTSGIVFDDNKQRTSLDIGILKIISSKNTKLIFNIEAATADTYNRVMGIAGCFEKLKQSIHYAHSFAITTEAHFVPMKPNIGEIRDVVALCQDLSVSKLSFLRLVLHGRAQINENQIALSKQELLQVKILLKELKKEGKIDIRVGIPLSINATCHKCEAASGKLNIKYDGNVFPCEVFKNNCAAHCLNGTKTESVQVKSLMDIYHKSEYLQLVRDLSQKFSSKRQCETCVGQYLINNRGAFDE